MHVYIEYKTIHVTEVATDGPGAPPPNTNPADYALWASRTLQPNPVHRIDTEEA